MRDDVFLTDLEPLLLRPALKFDNHEAWQQAHEQIVSRLPGEPWKGRELRRRYTSSEIWMVADQEAFFVVTDNLSSRASSKEISVASLGLPSLERARYIASRANSVSSAKLVMP